jgi:uncharacterized membrane protein
MRILGHPVHPMLVHFPIACWSLATLCDALALSGLYPKAWVWSAPLLVVGLAIALPAMVTGFLDLARIGNDAAARLADKHMIAMGTAFTLYLGALGLRFETLQLSSEPTLLPALAGWAGLAVMGIGGWLGGQLVHHHGIGTRFADDAANSRARDGADSGPDDSADSSGDGIA